MYLNMVETYQICFSVDDNLIMNETEYEYLAFLVVFRVDSMRNCCPSRRGNC